MWISSLESHKVFINSWNLVEKNLSSLTAWQPVILPNRILENSNANLHLFVIKAQTVWQVMNNYKSFLGHVEAG